MENVSLLISFHSPPQVCFGRDTNEGRRGLNLDFVGPKQHELLKRLGSCHFFCEEARSDWACARQMPGNLEGCCR